MVPEELRARTMRFALAVIDLYSRLPRTEPARVIGRQLLRSGTSVGANYRAACRPRSRNDFIAKLGIVIEEADETAYWLDVLATAGLAPPVTARLRAEADALIRIFVSSRETARRNARNREQ
jgi:four helix bundle protein